MEWLLKNISVIVVRLLTTHENAIKGVQPTLQPTLGRGHVILAYIRHHEIRRRARN